MSLIPNLILDYIPVTPNKPYEVLIGQYDNGEVGHNNQDSYTFTTDLTVLNIPKVHPKTGHNLVRIYTQDCFEDFETNRKTTLMISPNTVFTELTS